MEILCAWLCRVGDPSSLAAPTWGTLHVIWELDVPPWLLQPASDDTPVPQACHQGWSWKNKKRTAIKKNNNSADQERKANVNLSKEANSKLSHTAVVHIQLLKEKLIFFTEFHSCYLGIARELW